MPDKCILDPERDCLGLMKARELGKDVNELRKQNSSSHERIFDRLGELEKQEGIQASSVPQLKAASGMYRFGNQSNAVLMAYPTSRQIPSMTGLIIPNKKLMSIAISFHSYHNPSRASMKPSTAATRIPIAFSTIPSHRAPPYRKIKKKTKERRRN